MFTVDVKGPTTDVPQAAGLPAPRYVLPSADGWAYGNFVLDRGSLDYLTTSLPEIDDPLTRGSAWVTLWDALLEGQVPPAAFLDLTLRALPRESDEQMTSRILGYASNTWWRFLNTAERDTRAARFESLLREGLSQAADAEPEGGVVRHAAQCRASRPPRSAGCSRSGRRRRRWRACRSPKPITPRSRSSSPCARSRAGATSCRRSWAASRTPIARPGSSS